MNTGQNETPAVEVASSRPGVITNPTIYEMIEESSYILLEKNSPALIGYLSELLNVGKSPEQIVELIREESGLPRYRVAYLGCAAAHILKLKSMIVTDGVS